ncbi:hypothetical protein IFM89_013444 [Coptis chinensis]|uniref:Uncharacterized protein n=1 Tax=Coptis chinensis TaxID=261450 RepID=A0A835LDM1_9MAGN|nr:hypothetical protein IFM89_013444 [Coptis chinensis]
MFKRNHSMLFFSYLTSSFHFLSLIFYFSSILPAKLVGSFCSKTISKSTEDKYEVNCYEKEECTDEEDWESAGDGSCSYLHEEGIGFITFECSKNGDLVADTNCDGDALLASPNQCLHKEQLLEQKDVGLQKPVCEEPSEGLLEEQFCSYFTTSSFTHNIQENTQIENTNLVTMLVDQDEVNFTTTVPDTNEKCSVSFSGACEDRRFTKQDDSDVQKNFSLDGDFFKFSPKLLSSRTAKPLETSSGDAIGDSCTVHSTSKGSSEWRSSFCYRDSVSVDRFSSSSRRSCPTLESCTAAQMYDEEMMFYDEFSAQKLNETNLLKGVERFPRSLSQRILRKLTKKNENTSEFPRSLYLDLENAYVAQICVAWEALSLNYRSFLPLRALQGEEDPGCPAYMAQQVQQFQVLLQRFIENEPYERGRRPEVYSRIQISSPKLLQVPEFRAVDIENDQAEEAWTTKISSVRFIARMEDGIRIFMKFLKADKEKNYQIFKTFIRRNKRTCIVDPTLHHLLKKANKKKKKKIKDISRVRKCLRRALPRDEEMEMLMGLVDLKVVLRVLRMSEISEEQLHWCEEKMSKLRFWDGKLQRDSSPLPYPGHPLQ